MTKGTIILIVMLLFKKGKVRIDLTVIYGHLLTLESYMLELLCLQSSADIFSCWPHALHTSRRPHPGAIPRFVARSHFFTTPLESLRRTYTELQSIIYPAAN